MPYRLTKIYTRKGDEGYTHLGKKRLSKDDVLIEAIGTIDELNSVIGLIVSFPIQDEKMIACITQIQNDLFDLGGELYLPEHPAITADKVTQIEHFLDDWNKTLPPLKEFLLPRGNPPTATPLATPCIICICCAGVRGAFFSPVVQSLNRPFAA